MENIRFPRRWNLQPDSGFLLTGNGWHCTSKGMTVTWSLYKASPMPPIGCRFQPLEEVIHRGRGDGKEIYYRSTNGMLTALTVTPRDNTLLFGPPEPLFLVRGELTTAPFTAAPDGQKFLVRVPLLNGRGSDEITVLTDWRAGLKQ